MKIDFQGSYPTYRKANEKPAGRTNAAAAAPSAKTDVVEISRGQSPVLTAGLAALRSNILGEITASASPGRLEELQAKIKSGSYRPSQGELIDAILSE